MSDNQLNTIFDINPDTGKPFIEYEHAKRLAFKHVLKFGKNLLNHKDWTAEDLVQEIFLKACRSNYKPEKCAPATFLVLIAQTTCGVASNRMKHKGRDKEVSDYSIGEDDSGRMIFATSGAIEETTPEHYYLVKERLTLQVSKLVVWEDTSSIEIKPKILSIKSSQPIKVKKETLKPILNGNHKCTKCSLVKEMSAFTYLTKFNRPNSWCKGCVYQNTKRYRVANKE